MDFFKKKISMNTLPLKRRLVSILCIKEQHLTNIQTVKLQYTLPLSKK